MSAPPGCLYPQHMPSSGYRYGCRCARCLSWSRAYQRAYRQAHSRPPRPPRPPRPTVERFVRRIEVGAGGCWLWPALGDQGYGTFRYRRADGSQGWRAHAFSWEHWHNAGAKAPPGHEVDHLCNVRACCNPDHLQAVPKLLNVSRAITWSRRLGRVKLAQADADVIRQRLAAGETCASIAPDYGVSRYAVRDIMRGATWR